MEIHKMIGQRHNYKPLMMLKVHYKLLRFEHFSNVIHISAQLSSIEMNMMGQIVEIEKESVKGKVSCYFPTTDNTLNLISNNNYS